LRRSRPAAMWQALVTPRSYVRLVRSTRNGSAASVPLAASVVEWPRRVTPMQHGTPDCLQRHNRSAACRTARGQWGSARPSRGFERKREEAILTGNTAVETHVSMCFQRNERWERAGTSVKRPLVPERKKTAPKRKKTALFEGTSGLFTKSPLEKELSRYTGGF